jgi:hypothetical protein
MSWVDGIETGLTTSKKHHPTGTSDAVVHSGYDRAVILRGGTDAWYRAEQHGGSSPLFGTMFTTAWEHQGPSAEGVVARRAPKQRQAVRPRRRMRGGCVTRLLFSSSGPTPPPKTPRTREHPVLDVDRDAQRARFIFWMP